MQGDGNNAFRTLTSPQIPHGRHTPAHPWSNTANIFILQCMNNVLHTLLPKPNHGYDLTYAACSVTQITYISVAAFTPAQRAVLGIRPYKMSSAWSTRPTSLFFTTQAIRRKYGIQYKRGKPTKDCVISTLRGRQARYHLF